MEQETWRILIVEDDRRLAELLTQEYLHGNGGFVSIESDGASRSSASSRSVRPVVLDLMLPGEDGLSICRRVRDRYDGPILMRADDLDQVLAGNRRRRMPARRGCCWRPAPSERRKCRPAPSARSSARW